MHFTFKADHIAASTERTINTLRVIGNKASVSFQPGKREICRKKRWSVHEGVEKKIHQKRKVTGYDLTLRARNIHRTE